MTRTINTLSVSTSRIRDFSGLDTIARGVAYKYFLRNSDKSEMFEKLRKAHIHDSAILTATSGIKSENAISRKCGITHVWQAAQDAQR